LRAIIAAGGHIYRVIKRHKWVGEANVTVSIVHTSRAATPRAAFLDFRPVTRISAFLFDSKVDDDPRRLSCNVDGAFEGMTPYSPGFIASPVECELDSHSDQPAIFPYIGGKELNTDPSLSPTSRIIYFQDLSLETVETKWPRLLKLVEQRVRPDRLRRSAEVARAPWWLFWRARIRL
jgi:hypothetical protein